ncbi:MAG: hypothetical protein HKN87_14935 [Saprospiraceae bacterium]|nr:hypothetical protein [Saprospiraceae bacterium]
MSQHRVALTLYLLCMLYLVNAQHSGLESQSIRINFIDQASAAFINDVQLEVLWPHGEDIQVSKTDSSGWIQIDFNELQTIEIQATAHGYASDTFTLDLDRPRHTLPLTLSANYGKILDRQPIQRVGQKSQRRAPVDQDPLELLVMSEKRGGRISRLQRVPINFSGYTIFLRNDHDALRKSDPITKHFDKIMWQKQDDQSYDYYTGRFSSFVDAKNFLVEKVSFQIPDAKIIEFISGNGKRVDQ